MVKVKVKVKN